MKKYKYNKKVIISAHVLSQGPVQEFIKFLRVNNSKKTFCFEFSLYFRESLPRYKFYEFDASSYKVNKEEYSKKNPNIGFYMYDFFRVVRYVFFMKEKADIFVGFNNLNALQGILLRYFNKVDKVVYYCIDYSNSRFGNSIINYLYHKVEKYAAIYADEVWSLSPNIARMRNQRHGICKIKVDKILPMGVWCNETKDNLKLKNNKNQMVYMGRLRRDSGLELVIQALPHIRQKIPDISLTIIGEGEDIDRIKQIVSELLLDDFVTFKGYIENYQELQKIIASSRLGLALYVEHNNEENIVSNTDSGKIKEYLGNGIPVLISNVVSDSQILAEKGCAIIASDMSPKSLSNIVVKYFSGEDSFIKYRKNSIEYMKNFDWNIIFENAVKDLM